MKVEVKMIEWFDQHWYKLEIMKDGKLETRWIPSVTTKLGITDKPFLAKWRGDIGNREADIRLFESQERGSRIHHAFHVLTTGGAVIYNPWQRPNYTEAEVVAITAEAEGNAAIVKYQDEMLALVKLQKFLDIVKPEILFSEWTVYSLTHNDAGTADLGLRIKEGFYPVDGAVPLFIPGGAYIVDLKTGNMVSDEAGPQVAAYLKCAEEMDLGLFAGTLILHTSANTKKGIEGFSASLRKAGPEVDEDYRTYRLAAEMWERKRKNASPKVFEFPSLLTLRRNENETTKASPQGL